MEVIKDNWFTEKCHLWSDQCFSVQFDEILFQKKSKYQDILMLKTKKFGNVLVLDGIIQCTEFDEFTYQEMIAFLPLFSHRCPKNVLVIGGGDGGVLREADKIPTVTNIDLVEIDELVIDVSKQFLKNMAKGFDSPKVHVHVEDGATYLSTRTTNYKYDVIITDSGDAIGPNESLFEINYLQSLKNAIDPENGIVCIQSGCIWFDMDVIKKRLDECRKIFKSVSFASINVPTYPCGQIGFILASVEERSFSQPLLDIIPEQLRLQYYNFDMHRNAFGLPEFVKKKLGFH